MLILFDQGTPVGVRDCLDGHTVRTASELGWSALLNGDLLREAEKAGFDVLLTTDKNLVYQQNLSIRKIAVVTLGRSRWRVIRPRLESIRAAVEAARLVATLWLKYQIVRQRTVECEAFQKQVPAILCLRASPNRCSLVC